MIELGTGVKLMRWRDFNAAWVADTSGTCGIHIDMEDMRMWSFLFCVSTNAPYFMEFSHVVGRQATPEDFEAPRRIKMTAGSWVVFPARMAHRCVAAKANKRTIINATGTKL